MENVGAPEESGEVPERISGIDWYLVGTASTAGWLFAIGLFVLLVGLPALGLDPGPTCACDPRGAGWVETHSRCGAVRWGPADLDQRATGQESNLARPARPGYAVAKQSPLMW